MLGGLRTIENAASIVAALKLAGDARGAAGSWNELAAGAGALFGIGLGSIGLALVGIPGLGAALAGLAVVATVVSYLAVTFSRFSDDDSAGDLVRAEIG